MYYEARSLSPFANIQTNIRQHNLTRPQLTKRNIALLYIKIDILEETPFRALNGPSIFYRTHAAPTHASAASASHVWTARHAGMNRHACMLLLQLLRAWADATSMNWYTVPLLNSPWSSPKKNRFRKFWRPYLVLDQNLFRITNPVSDLTGDQ